MFDVRRSAPAPAKVRSANVMVMRIPNTTASIPPDESEPANRRPRTPSLTPVPAGTNTTRNPATQAITANSVANPKLLNDVWRSGAGFLNRLNPKCDKSIHDRGHK